MSKLQLLGGGQMGGALLAQGKVAAGECTICEVRAEAHEALRERFPGVGVVSSPVPSEAVVVAVKPGDVEVACRALAAAPPRRLLSIAAGVTTETLEGYLGSSVAVVRAMPNTPARIGAGATAIAAGASAAEADLDWAEEVLQAVGIVVRLPEHQLDAVTGLSGSGPAYVFLVAEALVEAGVLAGLGREAARLLANQTLLGAARLLSESGQSAEQLRAEVTSPGGTTAAALQVFERAGLRAAFLDAVVAATARSRELSRPH